ncbi:MAG: helix-turn-helix transcriptional regulator [Sporichthyaceae bacterium]|nr:helix-turn-helix transcriptional regulator [Sporichthyaceae bacterium]
MRQAAILLRRARRHAGMTQRQLAAAVRMHRPAVARLEIGRADPALETLAPLLRQCGYELDLVPAADPHDLSLLSLTLRLNPEERVDRLLTLHRTARDLQAAVRQAG